MDFCLIASLANNNYTNEVLFWENFNHGTCQSPPPLTAFELVILDWSVLMLGFKTLMSVSFIFRESVEGCHSFVGLNKTWKYASNPDCAISSHWLVAYHLGFTLLIWITAPLSLVYVHHFHFSSLIWCLIDNRCKLFYSWNSVSAQLVKMNVKLRKLNFIRRGVGGEVIKLFSTKWLSCTTPTQLEVVVFAPLCCWSVEWSSSPPAARSGWTSRRAGWRNEAQAVVVVC